MQTLFSQNLTQPLAEQMRPKTLADVVGQDHLLGPKAPLKQMIDSKKMASFILWGPPGCGKTTIARLLAENTKLHFEAVSAVFSGVTELRKLFEQAQSRRKMGTGTLLFVDEIHRFNKAQQDSFLPFIEDGTIILVGATTENPSFELNGALLSRCKVYVLKRLDDNALEVIWNRIKQIHSIPLDEIGKNFLKNLADGDARYFISLIETVLNTENNGQIWDLEALQKLLQKRAPNYDKAGESHYNLISALHKSLRGSDPQAGLYWLARMMQAGEDPKYILRRLTRFASEDVGLADPNALVQAISAWNSYERLGSPEGDLAIAGLVVYLATAPKSISVYKAWNRVQEVAHNSAYEMPPAHILNAPTNLMKQIGYGQNYQYDPETKDGFSGQNYFPDSLPRQNFYIPAERGFEREIKKRLDYWDTLRKKKNQENKSGV